MNRHLICAVTAMAVCASAAAKEIQVTETPADDSRITYIGRTLAKDGQVSFDWSGTVIKISFTGDCLAVRLSDTDKDYYNLWLDREEELPEADKVISVSGKDTLIELFTEADIKARYGRKAPQTHTVIMKKRTEGEQGKTTISSFVTKGDILQAPAVRDRVIEIIGDSYTCGYGSENSTASDPFTKESENQNKSYSAIIGRYFDADVIVVAHSGMGVARNYGDKLQGYNMPERYLNVFDNGFDEVPDAPKWSPDMFCERPDITVVYLGANDFSTSKQPSLATWTRKYIKLLEEIKAYYGEGHPVLCAAPKNDPLIYEYLREAVGHCGLKNVGCISFGDFVHSNTELGASSHPNYQAHKKIAHVFIPYIATMTGWETDSSIIQ